MTSTGATHGDHGYDRGFGRYVNPKPTPAEEIRDGLAEHVREREFRSDPQRDRGFGRNLDPGK